MLLKYSAITLVMIGLAGPALAHGERSWRYNHVNLPGNSEWGLAQGKEGKAHAYGHRNKPDHGYKNEWKDDHKNAGKGNHRGRH